MRDCEALRDELKAYLDGELSLVPRMTVRLHLSRCAACREEIKKMEQIGNELRAGDAGSLDPSLRAKILAGVPQGAPPASAGTKTLPKWRRRPILIWGAAAAAVLAWFVFYPLLTPTPMLEVKRSVAMDNKQALVPGTPPAPMGGMPAAMPQAAPSAAKPEMMAKAQTGMPASPGMGGELSLQGNLLSREAAKESDAMRHMSAHMAPAPRVAAGPPGMTPGEVHQPPASPTMTESTLVPTERLVHKEADITVEVDNVEAKSETVERMVKEEGGFVANNSLSTGGDDLKSASLTTKIPVAQFESFLSAVAKLGSVKAKNVTGEDVTEQTSDSQQAVHTLHEEIMETKAKLQERHSRAQTHENAETLRQLRIRSAQEQARLQMLNKMAALAQITVQLNEKPKTPAVKTGGGFMDEMNETAQTAIHSFLFAARLPVLVLIWLLAYSPVLILLAVTYRYVVRT